MGHSNWEGSPDGFAEYILPVQETGGEIYFLRSFIYVLVTKFD